MKRILFLSSLLAISLAAPAASKPAPKTVTLKDGLKYVDLVVGKGARPTKGQTVRVHYVGTLVDGTKFDSSRDRGQPFEFAIGTGGVIPGWDEGVATMRVGGRRKLIVPPALGYGAQGAGDKIPPNATLIFDIELLGLS
ncbi:MAG: FKBP-type peptidyl-prolyl cis-trans isomerase [Candidatus Eremiobacteraeota bacterium]|nr:FKBP-type peptidyl-prolyl cis-trans isomerase [Candidatus Eremiobacteraeota bacterium]